MPQISLIIPTLNAEAEIAVVLDSIMHQTVKLDEILIVDSSSTDNTLEIVKAYPKVKTIKIPRKEFDHGGTRHVSLCQTKGDFILFLTQDAIPADEYYVENILKPFADCSVALVSGRQIAKPTARKSERMVREINYPEIPAVRSSQDIQRLGIMTYFASDACSAYRRISYDSVGGFERPCATNEDMLMAATLINSGWKVAYEPKAAVFHSHNLSFVEEYKRNKEVGAFLKKYQDRLCQQSEVSHGKDLASKVFRQLIDEKDYSETIHFISNCSARLLGNRIGRLRRF